MTVRPARRRLARETPRLASSSFWPPKAHCLEDPFRRSRCLANIPTRADRCLLAGVVGNLSRITLPLAALSGAFRQHKGTLSRLRASKPTVGSSYSVPLYSRQTATCCCWRSNPTTCGANKSPDRLALDQSIIRRRHRGRPRDDDHRHHHDTAPTSLPLPSSSSLSSHPDGSHLELAGHKIGRLNRGDDSFARGSCAVDGDAGSGVG